MTPSGFYFDPQTLAGLRYSDDQRQTLERVAQQFESLFVHMLLKQMREASFGDGLFDSSQSTFYRDMFDAQMAQHVGGQAGLGIAQLLVRELGKTLADTPAAEPHRSLPTVAVSASATAATPQPATLAPRHPSDRVGIETQTLLPDVSDVQPAHPALETASRTEPSLPSVLSFASVLGAESPADVPSFANQTSAEREPAGSDAAVDWQSPQEFLAHLQPFARHAAQQLGVASEVLMAQATLETGWGRKLPRHPDGRNSFNLFGIKADSRWSGDWVGKPTLEFTHGAMRREYAQFRSYASVHESFQDYARFLRSDPRYAEALAVARDSAAYLHALQNAGYATDPHYAEKILTLVDSDRFRSALPPHAAKENSDDAV